MNGLSKQVKELNMVEGALGPKSHNAWVRQRLSCRGELGRHREAHGGGGSSWVSSEMLEV